MYGNRLWSFVETTGLLEENKMKKFILALLMMPSLCFANEWQHCVSGTVYVSSMFRVAIPHGWIVTTSMKENLLFIQDESHAWRC